MKRGLKIEKCPYPLLSSPFPASTRLGEADGRGRKLLVYNSESKVTAVPPVVVTLPLSFMM